MNAPDPVLPAPLADPPPPLSPPPTVSLETLRADLVRARERLRALDDGFATLQGALSQNRVDFQRTVGVVEYLTDLVTRAEQPPHA